ncbi:hypothetical protein DEM27_22170 [Metarhizobium album]|uniref:Uncharacterized protein n=2 Tax=Metarhizobium album TaxID=2182425 RepID=A0A2U2DL42_9HYPH|nr:hypothetical protein DEM27_22170 [Rhizobium album]
MLAVVLVAGRTFGAVVDDPSGEWIGRDTCTRKMARQLNMHVEPTEGGWVAMFSFGELRDRVTTSKDFGVMTEFRANLAFESIFAGGEAATFSVSNIEYLHNPFSYQVPNFTVSSKVDYEGKVRLIVGYYIPDTICSTSFELDEVEGTRPSSSDVVIKTLPVKWKGLVEARCNAIVDAKTLNDCMVTVRQISTKDDSFHLAQTRYLEDLVNRVTSVTAVSCSSDIDSLTAFTTDMKLYGIAAAFSPKSCDEAASVFVDFTGFQPEYKLCEVGLQTGNTDEFSACMTPIFSVDHKQAYRKVWDRLTNAAFGFDQATHGQDIALIRLWSEIESGHKEDRSYFWTDALRPCFEGEAPRRDNTLEKVFNAAIAGQIDNAPHRSITCSDAAALLSKVGMISEAKAAPLLALSDGDAVDLCSPRRAGLPPLFAEVAKPSARVAAAEFCSPDRFKFVVDAAAVGATFDVNGSDCSMSMFGLPLAQLGFRFTPSSCSNTGMGNAQCIGALRMICAAADPSRASLDCFGKNAELQATFDYSYDAASCEWTPGVITVDNSTARMTESLQ